MWTGRQTMASIEETVGKLHAEERRLDETMKSVVADAERLRRERDETLKELARVKLDEITAGRLVRDLDVAERRAIQVLADHRNRLTTATERKEVGVSEVEAAEKQRHSAAEGVEKALSEIEAVRAKAAEAVQATTSWQSAKARFSAAHAIAEEAEKKAAQSESELAAKRRPYDEDPLFSYLWRIGFGTPRYQAANVARIIDRTVAEFVGFSGARANYAMLNEIPLRLREHASAKRAAADTEQSALAAIERTAMVAAGLEVKERVLTEARHRLASVEKTLEAKQAQLKTFEEQRRALVDTSGGVPGYEEALRTIAQADARDDIGTLYREARRTVTSADEGIVRKIEEIDAALKQVDAELIELRKSARDLASRRGEVEDVRDRFRGAGYDHPHATFGNEAEIGRILAAILEGVVRSGVLWDVIRGGFRTRPQQGNRDFGSPTFPFPFPIPGGGSTGPSGGGWREPETRGGWFPPIDFPSSGGGGGDNGGDDDRFSTGGSF